MAKISFTKLALKRQEQIKTIDFNGTEIEVKQYLPTKEKIDIVTNVLQNSADANNFANPIKMEVFLNLEIMYAYTNIAFTDKQKEEPEKLYDLMEENGLFDAVIDAIPESEYRHILDWVGDTTDAFYKYRNSALGILEQVSADYSNLNFDAESIQQKIADPANLTLLKDVMDKLG